MRHSRLIFLLFSLSLLILAYASQLDHVPSEKKANRGTDGKDGENSETVEGSTSHSSAEGEHGIEGDLEVHEALSELHGVKSSASWLSRLDKKSGIVGATAYYATKGFVFLFMNGPSNDDYLNTAAEPQKLSTPLAKAVNLLETAAKLRNPDAIFLLAEMNFYGNYTHPRNYKKAFNRYKELADLNGNSTAQYMIGLMYATGLGNAVERDQAKAMLYHTFAAESGNTRSEMTLAYRYHSGIGTPRNCNEAANWYKKVADKAIEYARSGPPGGLPLVKEAYRIADEHGGVYGEGASWSSAGHNAGKRGSGSTDNPDFDNVMEYLDVMSKKGDLKSTFTLAKLNYDGSRTMKRNFKTARRYFMSIARLYWDKTDQVISEDNMGLGKIASEAAAHLGRFHLRGEGVPQSFERALRWFKLGVKNGDPFCQYEMGLMYLHGLGVKKDVMMAAYFFKESAIQDWPASQINLGKLFLDQGDLKTAMVYFELAQRHNHIEASYHLAEISNFGVGRERSCHLAVVYYKNVVEKTEALHSSFEEANRAYEEGDRETALVNWIMAAEQGYEKAQANVAYLLDEHQSIFSLDAILPWKVKPSAMFRNAALALIYWTRSAKQLNVDAIVKMGDYYLKGYGIDADIEKAVACYQAGTEMPQSAQALWNLGWMHENGIGIEQDFHLAKRFYDQALEVNEEAYLPVKLALLKLQARSWWNTITNGDVNSIQPEEEEDQKQFRTWSEWFANFYDEDDAYYQSYGTEDDLYDPLGGGEDYYYEDLDADILETLMIIALAGALAFLVYYRQMRQQIHRANEQRRRGDGRDGNEELLPGQQPDGGFFPPPDDPNFDMWRAGGIGH